MRLSTYADDVVGDQHIGTSLFENKYQYNEMLIEKNITLPMMDAMEKMLSDMHVDETSIIKEAF